MLNLYQETLLDHYRNPCNHGTVSDADFRSERRNSSCGDEIIFTGIITDNVLIKIRFQGKGCVISQAAASLLSEHVKNMNIETILSLDKDHLIAMLAIPLGPVRLMCGLLSLMALQAGITEYQSLSKKK